MRVAVLSRPRLRYRLATRRANLRSKKESHPRGLQQELMASLTRKPRWSGAFGRRRWAVTTIVGG